MTYVNPCASKRIYPTPSGGTVIPADLRLAQMKDVANAYGLTEKCVRRIVEERRVASVKLGKYRLVDLSSWEQMIADGYAEVTP